MVPGCSEFKGGRKGTFNLYPILPASHWGSLLTLEAKVSWLWSLQVSPPGRSTGCTGGCGRGTRALWCCRSGEEGFQRRPICSLCTCLFVAIIYKVFNSRENASECVKGYVPVRLWECKGIYVCVWETVQVGMCECGCERIQVMWDGVLVDVSLGYEC